MLVSALCDILLQASAEDGRGLSFVSLSEGDIKQVQQHADPILAFHQHMQIATFQSAAELRTHLYANFASLLVIFLNFLAFS